MEIRLVTHFERRPFSYLDTFYIPDPTLAFTIRTSP